MYKLINGDLLDSNEEIIVHQTNAVGIMGKTGTGIARYIRERFPAVYSEYINFCNSHTKDEMMGNVLFCKTNSYVIANLFGQKEINRKWYEGGKVTDYTAIRSGIIKVREYANEHNLTHIGFPFKFGCVRGGGDWETVKAIIKEELKNLDVTVYQL